MVSHSLTCMQCFQRATAINPITHLQPTRFASFRGLRIDVCAARDRVASALARSRLFPVGWYIRRARIRSHRREGEFRLFNYSRERGASSSSVVLSIEEKGVREPSPNSTADASRWRDIPYAQDAADCNLGCQRSHIA